MRGLLIKDLMLLKRQKTTLVMVAFFAIFMFGNGAMPPSGIIAYVAVFFTMMAISSVSYDEFDNGYAFLFTLPITVKTYVLEKYLYALLAACVSSLLSGGVAYIRRGTHEVGFIVGFAVGFALVMLLLVAVMMPLQLKFGVERSRLMGIMIGGLIGGAGVLGMLGLGSGRLGDVTNAFQKMAGRLGGGVLTFLGVCFVALAYFASMMVSIRIMKRKDF